MTAANMVLVTWGFVVGFIGWGACLRLIEPISNWLSPTRPTATAAALLVRLVVVVFLISAVMSAIAIGPLIMTAGAGTLHADWRALLGVSFWASMAGLVAYGVLQRFWGKNSE